MRILKSLALSLTLASALASAATAQEKTLFERLGGKEAITAVVDEFATRVLADSRINQKFAQSDPVRLKAQLVDQICAATKGPCQYTGRDMKSTHTNMGVTEGEFNALVEDLVGALDKFNVPETEKNELLGELGKMKGDIVEVSGTATGTALPKKFKPYKAGKGGKKEKGSKKMKEPKAPKEEKAKEEMKEEKAPKEKKSKKN